jgi:hypothetical protein
VTTVLDNLLARAGSPLNPVVRSKACNRAQRPRWTGYLDVARAHGFNAVVTLSNEIAPAAGEHPVAVDHRKLRKVGLFHLSWAEILQEVRMVLTHRGVENPLQAWILAEFIRYRVHPLPGTPPRRHLRV